MPVQPHNEIDRATLPPILLDFAHYKGGIENRSKLTVEEYLLDLRTFFRYMCAVKQNGHEPSAAELEETDITSVDLAFTAAIRPEDIYEFLFFTDTVLQNRRAAKARKLSAIKSFYKYLVNKRHLLEKNPAVDIDTPKKEKALPKFLSAEESLALLDAIAGDTASRSVRRDYAIATLFLNCGMRLSELCGIDMRDIDSDLRSVRVTGKGGKERTVYLNEACADAINQYLPHRLRPHDRDKNALFISRNRNRISVQTVKWLVKKYVGQAGLNTHKYSAHKLRHTAATLMYQNGVDVRVLKDVLGHENLNTTQIYTHVSNAQLENAMKQNPLADVEFHHNNDE